MTLSSIAIASAQAQSTAEVWLLLAEIDHPSLSTPIRVVNNPVDVYVVENGIRSHFVGLPFTIVLPSENDTVPEIQLKIDNVDSAINRSIQAIPAGNPPTCRIIVGIPQRTLTSSGGVDTVTYGDIPHIEAEFYGVLKNTEVTVLEASAIFGPEDILSEPYPGDSYTPNLYPCLF